jgi:hypothetical protein
VVAAGCGVPPYGGDAFLLTRYADVVKAYTDPHYDVIQVSDGDVARLEAGRVTGVAEEGVSLFSVSNARHNKLRHLVAEKQRMRFLFDEAKFQEMRIASSI